MNYVLKRKDEIITVIDFAEKSKPRTLFPENRIS